MPEFLKLKAHNHNSNKIQGMNTSIKPIFKGTAFQILVQAKPAILALAAICLLAFDGTNPMAAKKKTGKVTSGQDSYKFDRTISRKILENYLSRAITMQSLLIGQGDFDDNLRMLKNIGAKYIGRSVCQWGGETDLLKNFEKEKELALKVHSMDPDIILEACIFEIVTRSIDMVPVPARAFAALNMPVEKRNFRYDSMIYTNGKMNNQWGNGASVPDVSRAETKLMFYFLAVSYIDLGIEGIHFGQVELMNKNDPNLDNYAEILSLIRVYASGHARRHMLLCNSHVPSGGFIRNGQLLMDFHAFPLRIMEVPGKPQEAILKLGFSDGIYNRSKGGITYSGWVCTHLPYLVEFDNYGVSKHPGQPNPETTGKGFDWIWGYDEISWFARQGKGYRSNWLRYAWDWVKKTDPNGFLEMPGSRTESSPLDHMRWYYANTASAAVPDGLGDEETIKVIWEAEAL
jgi:Holliday junction resolvase-like predicted endonuclease